MIVTERMARAKVKMLAAGDRGWKRTPKAFYLNEADHAEFMATNPEMSDATFRCKPSREYGFEGVPVRDGLCAVSRLYSEAGTSVGVME